MRELKFTFDIDARNVIIESSKSLLKIMELGVLVQARKAPTVFPEKKFMEYMGAYIDLVAYEKFGV